MKIFLYGHDYKYAVEQMLMSMAPDERPEYPKPPEAEALGERMEVRLCAGDEQTDISCMLYKGADVFSGQCQIENALLTDSIQTDRLYQKGIKSAVYDALLQAGYRRSVWGAITGVRPGKVLRPLLKDEPEAEALRIFINEYDVTSERAKLCMDTTRVTMDTEKELGENDVCLYVGIPFCPTRCSYCSFVSQAVGKSMKLIPEFLAALYMELDATAVQVKALGLKVVSIYMGGGTPTTLSAEQLEGLCGHIADRFDLSALREYTVEAGRPDTITAEKLRVLRKNGVDRISVNPQTMSDTVLEVIGRKHSAADIREALALVRGVGGFAVNMDLIAGLPADSYESFRSTVEEVIALLPENITVHTLSMKRGSALIKEKSRLPDEITVEHMLNTAGEKLREALYAPYYLYRQKFMSGGFENVGWTKEGFTNLYNICIMEELCSILACGGGGSTKLIRHDGGRNIRFIAPKYPKEYIESIEKICEEKDKISEFYENIRRNNNGIQS